MTHDTNFAYIDCFSGISGDMLLAALLDAGFPLDELRRTLSLLGIQGECELRSEKVRRGGLSATRLRVDVAADAPHRSWARMRDLITGCALPEDIRNRTAAALKRLAECEAAIHNVPVDQVHFHELSGTDTLVDIAGAFMGMKWFGVETARASAVNVGSGTVICAHGLLPVPAPATAALLRDVPIFSRFEGEMTTPTGALLLTTFASAFGPMPLMTVKTLGHGAGGRDPEGHPNILRIFLGELVEDTEIQGAESIMLIQANIDDMNPQTYPYVLEKLLEAGARDAWLDPIIMKKGRPGVVINALCDEERYDPVLYTLLTETTTLGARLTRMNRVCLDRRFEAVDTPYGPINIKIGLRLDRVINLAPEYEDCAAAARRHGVPLLAVMDAARAAAATRWKWGDVFRD